MDETAAGGRHRFLIGYWLSRDRGGVRVTLAGQLGSGGAELLDACRARLQALPAGQISLDLTALDLAGEGAAASLAALCRALRGDGFRIDLHGPQDVVAAVLAALGPEGRGRETPHARPATAAGRRPAAVAIPED